MNKAGGPRQHRRLEFSWIENDIGSRGARSEAVPSTGPGADPRTEALWGLRLRVHDDADGSDILPAPGSPEDLGLPPAALSLLTLRDSGGDPELGELL